MFATGSSRIWVHTLVVALGVASWAGPAYAGDESEADKATQARKHATEMNKGKSHEDARSAASGDEGEKAAAQAKKHAEEMNKGKSHEDARSAAASGDEDEKATARAKKHATEMNKGKSHEDARSGAEEK
jgi:hypothetical protein